MPLYTRTFSSILAGYNVPPEISREKYLESAGIDLEEQFKFFVPEATAKKYVEKFWKTLGNKTPNIFSDVIDTLEVLDGGYMTIASGTRQEVLNNRVQYHGLEKYFSEWVGRGEKRNKKDYLNFLAGEIPSKFDKIFFIGDGKKDMNVARDLKMIGIAIVRNHEASEAEMRDEGASFVVRKLYDVPVIVNSI
jgi:phosphoglycolate phosphatase-like HAD superfamily hydrolase